MNDKITTIMNVNENDIRVMRINEEDYISLTDLAKYKNPNNPSDVIKKWLSNYDTIEFLGLWEELSNEKFNLAEFSLIKNEAPRRSFTMTPSQWCTRVNAIGMTYSKVKNCNGCVYTRYYEPKLIKETLKDYKKDYTNIKNKVFLGHKLDKNNNIIKSYICGIDKNEVFCLEGNNNGSKYKENKRILTKLYGKNKCNEVKSNEGKYYTCSSDIDVAISEKGINYISVSKSNQCYVESNGYSYCFGK